MLDPFPACISSICMRSQSACFVTVAFHVFICLFLLSCAVRFYLFACCVIGVLCFLCGGPTLASKLTLWGLCVGNDGDCAAAFEVDKNDRVASCWYKLVRLRWKSETSGE